METFPFYMPIQVRYGDLDAQWHVNNSKFLTYIEQSRFGYLLAAGLWNGKDFLEVGLIVADVHVAYTAPIELLQQVRVGVRVAHIGNKSLRFEYQVEDQTSGAVLARAETVMVSYDYHSKTSRPVPESWRSKIAAFQGEQAAQP